MTQFQPPPFPPLPGQQDYDPAVPIPNAPPRWSAAAIGAFILSLLGFLGVTAVLGLIFGIVGIITTSGGRRRGMGLAIAAIPISLVTGALSIFLLWAVFFVTGTKTIKDTFQTALGADAAAVAESANSLRNISSEAFKKEVSAEALQAWIAQINSKHGKLTSTSRDAQEFVSPTSDGALCFNLNGKFLNGPASIRLIIKAEQIWLMRLDDIEVGGSSPRGVAENPPESAKNQPTSATP